MPDLILLKHQLEDFLYTEADYCDNWELPQWLSLWAEGEVTYEIGPLDPPRGETPTKDDMLFLVSDNRFRLEQRVIRLQKSTAHAEFPIRSRLRHSYTNLRYISIEDNEIRFKVNLLVARTRADTRGVNILPGYVDFKIDQSQKEFKIREKRIFLDLNTLADPGTMAVIL
jgi:p-cumate 2,3-dioxygenase subunit beta